MQDNRNGMPHIEVYRASKHLKYQHRKPEGVLLIIYCIVSVFLLIFIQNGFFGASPDLVLVFVYLAAIKCKPSRAMLLGIFSGLAMDVLFGRYIGLYGILYMYVAFVACQLSEDFLNAKLRIIGAGVPLFLGFGIIESLIIRLISVISGEGAVLYTNYGAHFVKIILPGAFMNMIALVAMIFPTYILWRRLSPH
ncbi:MAG: rod shape-determining protein MreD [Ruminococcaceae bacterium]|nr:rod shape-determining protein MreD [Oscillospiraceae bacterium]